MFRRIKDFFHRGSSLKQHNDSTTNKGDGKQDSEATKGAVICFPSAAFKAVKNGTLTPAINIKSA